MTLPMSRALAVVALLTLCVHAGASLAASTGKEGYPSRPVRFIIPFPPGGGTDIVGRVIGQKLADALNQPFVIDNRAGAAGTLGSSIAAKAPADGYTILLATASFAISASFYRNLPYDPVKDFDAVGLIALQPLALVVHPSVPAKSAKELIALAKAKPDVLNFASSSAGGITHLAGELFKSITGIRIVHVPYKGSNPALTAVLTGQVHLMIGPVGPALPHIQSGKLRALAMGSAQRSALLPELPTLAEAGVPGYEAGTWYGMLAPSGMPAAVIRVLNQQIGAALKSKDVVERFAALGFEPASSTPARFAEYMRSEIAKWARTMKEAGVQPN